VDPVLEQISSQRNISTGEVLLKWAKAHGAVIITTSSKASRMKSMLHTVLDDSSNLSPVQVQEINQAGIDNGIQRVFMKHSKPHKQICSVFLLLLALSGST
jgi:diketogulonate reductase-like aldo/keto reductase